MPDNPANIDKELHALVSLLDEPDTQMFGKVSKKLLSYGVGAIPILENTWDNCFDDFVQQRIENLIHNIQFETTTNEFSKWANLGNHQLFEGYFLITKYMYPELEKEDMLESVGKISDDVRHELSDNLTALEKVKVINHIIYDIHKFRANRRRIQSAQNHFLNNLLDTKKGSNLSLGMLYLIIAQELDLPIYGVDLPRHFVFAFTKRKKLNSEKCLPREDILFFINPFTGGSVITREDIELSIKQMNIAVDPSLFCPCDEIKIIKRLLDDLLFYFKEQDFPTKVRELEILLECLPI